MIEINGQLMMFEDDPSILHLSEDEINLALCRGSPNSKRMIRDFVLQMHGRKENACFIKNVYGICGWSHAVEGRDGVFLDATGKGIRFAEFKTGREIWFSWEDVARRIELLVKMGQYVEG